MRINVPLGSMRANHAERALRILEGSRRFRIWTGVGHTILHQHACDVDRVEPVTHLRSLKINGHDPVATARKYHHGSAGVLLLRSEDSQSRCGDVPDAHHRPACDGAVL